MCDIVYTVIGEKEKGNFFFSSVTFHMFQIGIGGMSRRGYKEGERFNRIIWFVDTYHFIISGCQAQAVGKTNLMERVVRFMRPNGGQKYV